MLKQIVIFMCLAAVALAIEKNTPESIHIAEGGHLNQEEFATEALMAHNLYRRIHGVPALKLNGKLVDLAITRARELSIDGKLNVKQILFNKENLGETVGTVGGFSSYNGISATQLWYSVVSKFDEEGESSNEGASFTQMVWKKTREVGFGIAKGKDGKFYFVAEYFPSGNIRGQYEDNVFQLTEEEIGSSSSSGQRCVNQTVVDMWKKMLAKANLSSEERVERPVVVQTTTPEMVEATAEVPTKKLKSKLPVVVESTEEIVRVSSTRRPVTKTTTTEAPVEEETTTRRSTTARRTTTTTTEAMITRTTPEPEEETTTTIRTTRRSRPVTTTIEPEIVAEAGEVLTTRPPRPRVEFVDATTPEIIRATTVNPDLIITVDPSLMEPVSTTTRRTTTVETTPRPTSTRRITTTTPMPEEETTTTVRVTTTEEPRTTRRPITKAPVVAIEVEEVKSTSTRRPVSQKEEEVVEKSTTTASTTTVRTTTVEPVSTTRRTTTTITTTVAPSTTTPVVVASSTEKVSSVPRMTPTVVEDAVSKPSKSKLLEQIRNSEEIRTTTMRHVKKEVDSLSAEEGKEEQREEEKREDKQDKKHNSFLTKKSLLNKKENDEHVNENQAEEN